MIDSLKQQRVVGELVGMSYIGNRIFIGGYPAASNENLLRENNVRAVVTCAHELCPKVFNGIAYHHVDLRDRHSEKLVDHLLEAIPFIDKHIKRGNVLIHCAMGKSRSVSIAIAYLILRNNLSFQNALKLIRRARYIAKPNSAFQHQLKLLKEAMRKHTQQVYYQEL